VAAIILFKTTNRDESHQELERVLAAGEYPKAECREADEKGDYTVWSGAQRDGTETVAALTAEAALAQMDDAEVAKLTELLAARKAG
jgi:hypothetical protein